MAKQFVKESEIDRYVDQQVTKDINDAIESLEYEINTLYTSNGQTPFVTLGFGLGTDHLSRKNSTSYLKYSYQRLRKRPHDSDFPKTCIFN
ncbi:anaerobic ribonucleoside-triphosphate reductase [Staphylococcus aureus]